MEGGQDFNIPLDAPIEIESETTVVPSSAPTFLTKPSEKYNGVLGPMIKYEGEGWFYDWKHVRLENALSGETPRVSPKDFTVRKLVKYNDDLLLVVFDNGLSFKCQFNSNTIRNGDELSIDFTYAGNTETLVINANTFAFISCTLPDNTYRTTIEFIKQLVKCKVVTARDHANSFRVEQMPSAIYKDKRDKPFDIDKDRSYSKSWDKSVYDGTFQVDAGALTSLDAEYVVVDDTHVNAVRSYPHDNIIDTTENPNYNPDDPTSTSEIEVACVAPKNDPKGSNNLTAHDGATPPHTHNEKGEGFQITFIYEHVVSNYDGKASGSGGTDIKSVTIPKHFNLDDYVNLPDFDVQFRCNGIDVRVTITISVYSYISVPARPPDPADPNDNGTPEIWTTVAYVSDWDNRGYVKSVTGSSSVNQYSSAPAAAGFNAVITRIDNDTDSVYIGSPSNGSQVRKDITVSANGRINFKATRLEGATDDDITATWVVNNGLKDIEDVKITRQGASMMCTITSDIPDGNSTKEYTLFVKLSTRTFWAVNNVNFRGLEFFGKVVQFERYSVADDGARDKQVVTLTFANGASLEIHRNKTVAPEKVETSTIEKLPDQYCPDGIDGGDWTSVIYTPDDYFNLSISDWQPGLHKDLTRSFSWAVSCAIEVTLYLTPFKDSAGIIIGIDADTTDPAKPILSTYDTFRKVMLASPASFDGRFINDIWSTDDPNHELWQEEGLDIYWQYVDKAVFEVKPNGTFQPNKPIKYITCNDSYSISFEYDGKSYRIDIPKTTETQYQWWSEDIRTRKNELLRTYSEQEYIVCQSHWNDSQLEKDCWVVDEDTIYVQHFNDKLSMWKKVYRDDDTPHPDVFQTFMWKKVAEKRWSSLDMGLRYGVSSAVENVPFIWAFRFTNDDRIYLKYMECPTKPVDFEKDWSFHEVAVDLDEGTMGTVPEKKAMTMYDPIMTAEEIWNVSKISATRVGNQFWFGISCDRCLKQWTIKCSAAVVSNVVTGYGFVGLDGTLTGGQFPSQFVNATNGWIGVLEDVADLWEPCKKAESQIPIKLPNNGGVQPPGDGTPTTKLMNKDFGGNAYCSGTMYCLDKFDKLVIAIDGTQQLVTVPAHSSAYMFGTNKRKKKSKVSSEAFAMGFYTPVCVLGRMGTAAASFMEAVSSSWKTFADNGPNDYKFEIVKTQTQRNDTDGKVFYTLCMGAALAGAAASSLTTPNPTASFGPNMQAAYQDQMKKQQDLSNKMVSDTGDMRAYFQLSDIYNIGQQSAIWAGPGFVQTQMAKCASLMANGMAIARYTEEGMGMDPKKFILIPAIVVGVSSGVPSYFHPFGAPSVDGISTGLLTSTVAKSLPYRKYGYAHRYINYPTKDVYHHELYDFDVEIDPVQDNLEPSEQFYMDFTYTETIALGQRDIVEARYACIEGSTLDQTCVETAKKSEKGNENLTMSDPFVYDFCVFPGTDLYFTAAAGEIVAVSIKDTKVLDGIPSNIVIKSVESGKPRTLIGSCYAAIEVLHPDDYDLEFLRPRVVTPQTLLMNSTGYNCIHADRIYHVCDAYSNRIIRNYGREGVDIEKLNTVYTFHADDDFKQSNIFPPMAVFGSFTSAFSLEYPWIIEMHTPFYQSLKATAEPKESPRFSIPVIFNRLSILPAVAKTIAAYKLLVVEGVTSMVTELRNTLPESRRPDSLDFPIYGQIYRWNPEYISKIEAQMGVLSIKELVATIGLQYVGSTPEAAWFYSQAIRSFYKFQPTTIARVQNADRFKEVGFGTFDFVQQEVVFNPLTPRGRMIIRNAKEKFVGDMVYPNETIGPFEFYSQAGGMVFQGRRRFQVARFLITEDMVDDIKANAGKWRRKQGKTIKDFWKPRKYDWEFDYNEAPMDKKVVDGWFLEPHTLATALIGVDDYQECKFEWLINFAVSDIILDIWGNRFITVYMAAETMTVNGVVESVVSKVRLHKNLFARQGQYGYYSYKYNANNGIGDSERFYLWSDGPYLLRSLKGSCGPKTNKRTSAMEDYEETKGMSEV